MHYYVDDDGNVNYGEHELTDKEKAQYYFQLSYNYAGSNYDNWVAHLNRLKSTSAGMTEYRRMESIGAPGFYNTRLFGEFTYAISSSISSLFLVMMLVVFFVPVFTQDYKRNMHYIVRSSKNGDSQLVNAKLKASVFFAVITVSIYYWLNIAFYLVLYKNGHSLYSPLNSLSRFLYTPYDWNIMSFLIINYFTLLLSVIEIVLIIFVISIIVRNDLMSICLSVILLFVPLFIARGGLTGRIITSISPVIAMDGTNLYGNYVALNILGKPIMAANIYICFSIVFSFMCILLIHNMHKFRYAPRI